MMISPESFIIEYEDKTNKELLPPKVTPKA